MWYSTLTTDVRKAPRQWCFTVAVQSTATVLCLAEGVALQQLAGAISRATVAIVPSFSCDPTR